MLERQGVIYSIEELMNELSTAEDISKEELKGMIEGVILRRNITKTPQFLPFSTYKRYFKVRVNGKGNRKLYVTDEGVYFLRKYIQKRKR